MTRSGRRPGAPAFLASLATLASMQLLMVPAAAAANGDAGTVASADTYVSVEAGERAPRVTALGTPAGPVWINRIPEALPEQVVVRGAARRLTWRFDRAGSHLASGNIELVYASDAPSLKARWRWRARAVYGPLEHTIVLENHSEDTVWLPLQASLRFDWAIAQGLRLNRFWVEKGADTPSAAGVHLDELRAGEHWQGTSSTYARPLPEQPREMIPYVLVTEPDGAQRGWFVGIEFSGRTRILLERTGDSLRGEAGLNPEPGPYRTRLPPGATFVAPTVFLGTASGGADGAGNLLRRWVREVLGNPRTRGDPTYPLTVSNSWGSGMAVDETLARRMIVDAAQLGLEMFHLDAGWFRGVGDWQADAAKFPHGIAGVADFAHAHGLKFGLWIDWTQAGASREPGALNVYDRATRDWLIADPPPGWRHTEPFKGITTDLGLPAVQDWAERELERLVNEFHLDMLEHDGYLVAQGSTRGDHPAAPPDPATVRVYDDSGYLWVDGSNSTDVSYHASRAYYEVYERLRARHPQLLLEVCNDGGRMVDFGSAAHGDYFSITDTYDPLSNRRAFYDASFVLPPAMLESYVAQASAPSIETFRYIIRSGMMGWFSLMQDTTRWTTAERRDARLQVELYKRRLRPLIRAADLYHVSARPDGVHWDGMEYYSPALGHGVLYAFRGSAPDAPTHTFQLRGLDPRGRYSLRFQDRVAPFQGEMTGQALMTEGITVTLAVPLTSELVFFEQSPVSRHDASPVR